jgi:hypothetical protein
MGALSRLQQLIEINGSQVWDMSKTISKSMMKRLKLLVRMSAGFFPPNLAEMIKLRPQRLSGLGRFESHVTGQTRDVILFSQTLPNLPVSLMRAKSVVVAMATALHSLVAAVLLQSLLIWAPRGIRSNAKLLCGSAMAPLG